MSPELFQRALVSFKSGRELSPRFPLENFEIDPAGAIDGDTLCGEPSPLLLEPPSPPERDPDPAPDDPMPGQALGVRAGMENPGDASSGSGVPGQGRDLSVGRDPTARDFSDGFDDLSGKSSPLLVFTQPVLDNALREV